MFFAPAPQPITLKNLISDEPQPGLPLTFRTHATIAWCNDSKWATPLSRIESLRKVLAEVRKAPDEIMAFEDADRAVLLEVMRDPDVKQQPFLLVQIGPFSECIEKATNVDPRTKAEAHPAPPA